MSKDSKVYENGEQLEYGSDEKQVGVQPVTGGKLTDDLRTVDAGIPIEAVLAETDEQQARRVLRKIDYRLIPLLSLLYL